MGGALVDAGEPWPGSGLGDAFRWGEKEDAMDETTETSASLPPVEAFLLSVEIFLAGRSGLEGCEDLLESLV